MNPILRTLLPLARALALAATTALLAPAHAAPFEDTLAQRLQACTACHGPQGRAGPDGYYPRLAGKPAGYLYNQLLNFRDGRRAYQPMAHLLEPLPDAYLLDMAQYFAGLQVPYPTPQPARATAAELERARQLVTSGDPARRIPACAQCHGTAMTGVAPGVPGLLGLPRDYLVSQLGAWRSGQRRAHAPDCMASVARALAPQDVTALAGWLAAQPLPAHTGPAPAAAPARLPASGTMECGSAPPVAAASVPAPARPEAVVRGEYLTRAGNCMACHTARGGTPWAGGRAIDTPFGQVFSTNLTPDPKHGLGQWSADDFWNALHQGRSRDGRLLYPAFPYTSLTRTTRADADAMWAYLRTLPAAAEPNRAHTVGWPYNTQWALWAWRTLFFTPGRFAPEAGRSAEWNRGAYLVQGLGHCAECHAPRNALGATRSALDLAGGLIPLQNWYAPSLSRADEAGVAAWAQADVVELLRAGVSPRGFVSGPMAEVVARSTQHLTDADLKAMATYLRELPGAAAGAGASAAAPAAVTPANPQGRGARLYENHCAQCHGAQGQGVPRAYPPLAGNRAVTLASPANLVQVVVHGGFSPATASNPRPFGMPPYQLVLTERDVADVLSYIRSAWGNRAPEVTELDVARLREVRAR